VLSEASNSDRSSDAAQAAAAVPSAAGAGSSSAAAAPPRTAPHPEAPPPLDPSAFDYMHHYDQQLGRHEGYFIAMRSTRIRLPLLLGTTPDAAGAAESCTIQLSPGDLVRFELSYKYSDLEVSELAAAAGLARVGMWTDSRGLYDLHLLAPAADGDDGGGGGEVAAGGEGREDGGECWLGDGRQGTGELEQQGSAAAAAAAAPADGAAGGGWSKIGSTGSPPPTWADWQQLWRLWDAATLEVS